MSDTGFDDRDYADLHDTNLAVYNFRGYTVLRFHKDTKELEIGKDAQMCSFIKADLKLMSEFLDNCYQFAMGTKTELESVSVD